MEMLTGQITSDDHGHVFAFVTNEAGRTLEIHSEPIPLERFDTPAKAKEYAALRCRDLATVKLRHLADCFENNRVTSDH